MSATPLAEVYEELKQLRRAGDDEKLRSRLHEALHRDVADRYIQIEIRGKVERTGFAAEPSDDLVRHLDILTLAERVFGDLGKAETWLKRPNASLSGQRPADLLKDELGVAVVREILQQIDHGIFA
jgi:putative toxin-antitoxin system antitoxin component (TIGR02293 family)